MSEWKESLSLEETNKIRISLGLKPISDSPSATKTNDQQAEDNFNSRKQNEDKERNAADLKARIDRARNTKERAKKLVGVGLGQDEDEGDTKAWVKRQKKRAKELAAKREKDQEEMDNLAEQGLAEYGERDLTGIKVAHEQDDFEEGEETVLTLKDSRILDDEDDELHNLNISENAKTAEAVALKKKGKQAGTYTGYDDDEFVEGGGKSSVLKKYDEELEGKQEEGFRLGGQMEAKPGPGKRKLREEEEEAEKRKVKLNLDYTKIMNTDYLEEDEVGFKKPKKKKKRATRTTATTGSDNEGDQMDVDDSTSTPIAITRTNLDDTNLIDDDELQSSLARARREQSRKKVAEMKKHAAMLPPPVVSIKKEDDEGDSDDDDNVGGVILDDTSEFVRNMTLAAERRAEAIKAEAEIARVKQLARENGLASTITVSKVVKEEEGDVPLSELGGGWGEAREDGEESDVEMGADEVEFGEDGEVKLPLPKVEGEEDVIGGRELLVSKGLASTLSILRHQGLVKERSAEEMELDRAQKERAAWVAERRRMDIERELEKKRSKELGSAKDQHQREWENRQLSQKYAQAELESYSSYKPVVNLTYHDEFGRNQTPKEAWKQLSHDFHGKAGGARATDRRLKRIADEKKREAMASGDTPLSTATAFAARAERMGTATMVLSVGNKGAAPNQEQLLGDEQRLKKSKGKGKVAGDKSRSDETSGNGTPGSLFQDIPMRPLPLPATERTGSPAVRAGFTPVGSFSPAVQADGGAGPSGSGSDKGKIQIVPTSIKRKSQK